MVLANITQAIVGILFILICILLILVILVQKGRGGGLAGAFGGAGGHSAFGAKTGDVFTWITVGLTFAFILMAVIGNYVFVPEKIQGTTPAAQNAPAPTNTTGTPALPPTGGTSTQQGA
jgi:preprotein translocase subunit SecG